MAEDHNGTAPTPPATEDAPAAGVPASERLMGLFGLAVAIGIALIAIDLMTGGALARLVPTREPGEG